MENLRSGRALGILGFHSPRVGQCEVRVRRLVPSVSKQAQTETQTDCSFPTFPSSCVLNRTVMPTPNNPLLTTGIRSHAPDAGQSQRTRRVEATMSEHVSDTAAYAMETVRITSVLETCRRRPEPSSKQIETADVERNTPDMWPCCPRG